MRRRDTGGVGSQSDRPASRARFVPGLRARLVAALVLTSAATLGVAAVALLNPLETRLRHQELKSLSATAVASLPALEDPETGVTNSATLLPLALALERRTGARVAIIDSRGNTIVDTRPDEPFGPVPVARSRNRPAGRVRARSSNAAAVAVAAVPFRVSGQRYVLALRKPLDDVTAAAADVQHAFTDAALAGLGIALLLGFGFATYLVRRLRRLRNASMEVGDHGVDAVLPADTGRDEVGDLARAFRNMQVRLHHQEEARRQFVATASHELRTPLASLQGMLELLEQDLSVEPPDLADARDQVMRAEAQSRRLATLAADLLDLTRLDADVELRSEPVELGELCRAVAAEFELRLAERGPRVELDSAAGPCWATGDPGSIARIVRILLDNALRYSPFDRPISIRLQNRGPLVEVRVEDEGPGVPEEEREVIFERFRRGRATGGEGGFGLGLAIGRGLALRMGGELSLEPSERGARFALRLPASVDAPMPALPAHSG